MQTQGVEESGQSLHEHKHGHGEADPQGEDGVDDETSGKVAAGERQPFPTHEAGDLDGPTEHHVPQDVGELCVCQRQGPQPEVGRGVRHGGEHVLDGVDGLVHHHVAEGFAAVLAALVRLGVAALLRVARPGHLDAVACRAAVAGRLEGLVRRRLLPGRHLDVHGLGQQQDGHHQDGDEKEGPLERLLAGEHVLVAVLHLGVGAHQHHVDEGDEHRGRAFRAPRLERRVVGYLFFGIGTESEIFVHHHEDHVAEE